jgi:CheY-like chemotaxis protein
MPPEVVARAFEPFFTTKERGRGTGLGLPMVYGFARQSGGDVRIYSEAGRGTSINLYLPLAATAAEAPAAPSEAAPQLPRGEESVLLVDDEPDLRALTAEWLGQLGYRVAAVGGPKAALAAMESGTAFDLLLSDVIMPGGMDGVALVKKARERVPGLPALLISGFMDMQVGTELPCEVLQKPFRQAELAQAVRRALAAQASTPRGGNT